jgi:rhomboid protease GluP
MGIDLFLIQLVGFCCLVLLLQWRKTSSWALVAAGILAVIGLGFAAHWPLSRIAAIGTGLWLILLAVPLLGFAKVNQLAGQEKFQAAGRLASWVRWLHPIGTRWIDPICFRALALAQQGQIPAAEAILGRDDIRRSPTGQAATTLLYRMTGRWDGYLTWVRQNLTERQVFDHPTLGTFYLRCLGELGDLNGLLQGLVRFEPSLAQRGGVQALHLCRMQALAFCGQPELVRLMFDRLLPKFTPEIRRFWVATAELAAGNGELAREQLNNLQQQHPSLKSPIAWRLAQPPAPDLTASAQALLSQLSQTVQQELLYRTKPLASWKTTPVTWALIGLNLIVFALSFLYPQLLALQDRYAPDLAVPPPLLYPILIFETGGMMPDRFFAGEWWRALSGIFLHAGWIHLGANMLGLYVLGGIVEPILGGRKFTLAYFWSGLGSMIAVAAIAMAQQQPHQFIVGASGAIMGLVGVMGAAYFKEWRRYRAPLAGQRLRSVVLLILLQTGADLVTPQVSIAGHLAGLGLGVVAGLVLATPRGSADDLRSVVRPSA